MPHLYLSKNEIKYTLHICTFIFQVDVDGSGFLEFPEFALMMHKKLCDTDTVNYWDDQDGPGLRLGWVFLSVQDIVSFIQFC